MNYRIVRGSNQIGGNVIEVWTDSTKILLDIGKALDDNGMSDEDTISAISGINYNAVIMTHYHEDHIGLNKSLPENTKFYIGEDAYKVLKASKGYMYQDVFEPEAFLKDGQVFQIGDLTITPFLCDHSAMDSYMVLVDDGKQKLLYTGDFRSNGRKSFNKLIEKLPTSLDILICEGTTLSGEHHTNQSEYELEKELTKEVEKRTGPVFILQSGTNIDRIVTSYKVAKRNNRLYLQDLYMSEITTSLRGSIPNPIDFSGVKTYLTKGYSDDDSRKPMFERHRLNVIGKEELSNKKFIMNVRPSHINYLAKLSEIMSFDGGLLIMSMWKGYLNKEEFKEFVDFLENKGVQTILGHVSGHADAKTIERLVKHMNPVEFVTVHTKNKRDGSFCFFDNTLDK